MLSKTKWLFKSRNRTNQTIITIAKKYEQHSLTIKRKAWTYISKRILIQIQRKQKISHINSVCQKMSSKSGFKTNDPVTSKENSVNQDICMQLKTPWTTRISWSTRHLLQIFNSYRRDLIVTLLQLLWLPLLLPHRVKIIILKTFIKFF